MSKRIALVAVLGALLLPGTAQAQLGDRPLRRGAHGTDVRTLQGLLTTAGFRTSADGSFGRATQAALRSFQDAAKLRPTGVATRTTVAALRTAAASATPAAAPPPATAGAPSSPTSTGGAPGTPAAPVPAATLGADGQAAAPAGAPPAVTGLVAAANRINALPYRYGGGHASPDDTAYDCSGSVSYALRGAGLLTASLDSSGLAAWAAAGPGSWITVYANKGHTFLVVAGLRFDTSGMRSAPGAPSRWQAAGRSVAGFAVRHPAGL
jgi:peptidoglycan hydrolase-like protein with peptidoglycan-binding domain